MSLFAVVSSSYAVVKKVINAQKEFSEVSQYIGKWMTACSDLEHEHNKLKNPSIITRLKKGRSIEEESFQLLNHKKTIEKQRDELQHHIIWTLGMGQKGWLELLEIERQLRVQRKREKYEAEARKEKIQFIVGLTIVIIVGLGLLFSFTYGLWVLDRST